MTEDHRPVRRVARLLAALKGHSLTGLSLTDLSKTVGENASTVLRTLRAMESERLVRQDSDTQRWALDVAMLAIATSHEAEISRAVSRAQDFASRVRAAAA